MSPDDLEPRPLPGEELLCADAWVLGARLDLRAFSAETLVLRAPDTFSLASGGIVAAFRYGAVVFFGVSDAEQSEWIARLAPFITAPLPEPERDVLEIRVDKDLAEGMDPGSVLVLNAASIERLQVVAHVLAKSTVLGYYEQRIAESFSRVEARAQQAEPGIGRRQSRELVREIQEAVLVRVQTVGRVELTEKPEFVWDDAELDRLYERLAVEYELRERDAALSRKLELITETATMELELIHTRRGLRVEWYIVALIAFEIVLIVYDILRH